jgi:hypothetical protein
MRWLGHVACRRNMRNTYNILVCRYKGKRPFRRCRHRWEDNIKKCGMRA